MPGVTWEGDALSSLPSAVPAHPPLPTLTDATVLVPPLHPPATLVPTLTPEHRKQAQ